MVRLGRHRARLAHHVAFANRALPRITPRGVSAPIRRIGPLGQIGPPKESRPAGDSARPANHPLQANRIRRDHCGCRRQPGSFPSDQPVPRITPRGESARIRRICPLRQTGPPKDSRSARESDPSGSSRSRGQPGSFPAIQPVPRITHSGRIGALRRIGPLWQTGLPKDPRSAGESGLSGSSRPPGPAGIRSGESARPTNHPLGANRRPPANRSPLANRPAQGPSLRRRIECVGIIAVAGASRDPFRRIGPLWQVGPPKDSRPAGKSGPSESSRSPGPAGIRSGDSVRRANHPLETNRHPSGEPAPGSWSLAHGPLCARRDRRGDGPGPPSLRRPTRALRERGQGSLRRAAVRGSCGICLTFAKGCRRNLSGNAVPPESDTRRWHP